MSMADDVVESLREVAARWDLSEIQQEVMVAVSHESELGRPYVATNLIRALDMFIDAYR